MYLHTDDNFMYSRKVSNYKFISSDSYNNQFKDKLTEDIKNTISHFKVILSELIRFNNLSNDLAKENEVLKRKSSSVIKRAGPLSNSGDVIIKNIGGLFEDGWCTNKLGFNFINQANTTSINIHLINPLNKQGKLTIFLNNLEFLFNIDSKNHVFKIKLLLVEGRHNEIKIISTIDSSNDHDKRKLSYVLKQISFN